MRLALTGFAAASLLLVSACAANDRFRYTEFEPGRDGAFRYRVTADAAYPEDDQDAEGVRLAWLGEYLRDNRLCPGGYDITERKAVLKRKGFVGDVYDVIYYGSCAPSTRPGA
ncbi:MAG: hypothetical protein AB1918_08795 [Pseudomonadota bacterium]